VGLGKYNDANSYLGNSIEINPNLLSAMKTKEFTVAYIHNTGRRVKNVMVLEGT
jgi:hypothetical protein